jgi:hypothetical protein
LAASFNLRFLFLLVAHMTMALAMRRISLLGTVHALGTLALGLYFLRRDDGPRRLIVLAAYLAGAEILWRMTGASVFWEFGKYAMALLLILATLKYRRLFRAGKWPVFFFVALLPAVLLLPDFDREVISFNLSGPFSLAVALMFFSTVHLDHNQLRNVLLAILLPVAGVASIAMYSTLTAPPIAFGRSSLDVTSGGFGPNQVSSILGLGALAALLYVVVERRRPFLRLLAGVCAVWFVSQAALTFSRGGIVTTVAALAVAGLYLLRDRRSRLTFIVGLALALVVWTSLIYPALNRFTGGALATRLADTDPTGRDLIVQADLLAFRENPVFGAGLGRSPEYHALLFRESSAHTEFTRWLAEHGSFGLLALLIFGGFVLRRLFRPMPALEKAIVLSFTVWAILFMSHAAMRLVAPSFIFALGAAQISLKSRENNEVSSSVIQQTQLTR